MSLSLLLHLILKCLCQNHVTTVGKTVYKRRVITTARMSFKQNFIQTCLFLYII